MNNMRGQAPLISHTIMIGFSVLLIIIIVAALNSIKLDYQEFIGKEEILQVCIVMKSGVEKIYLPTSYTSKTNDTMGSIVLDLPAVVGDVNYRMDFINKTLYIETLSLPILNQSCKIGFNASFTGSSPGGRVRLSWVRYTNSTDIIRMDRVS